MKDLMMDLVGTDSPYIAVHTAYDPTGFTHEVSGGSYARFLATWSASSGGVKALAATLPSFPIPASTPIVSWWSGASASSAGTRRFHAPIGGGTLRPCAVEVSGDLTSNLIFSKAHGYVAGTRVVFWGTLPTGLAREDPTNGPYFVIAAGLTADAFSVATTAGGSAIDITGTAPYVFDVQSCTPEAFVSAGTLTFGATSIDINAIA